jgi:hypothetical protein
VLISDFAVSVMNFAFDSSSMDWNRIGDTLNARAHDIPRDRNISQSMFDLVTTGPLSGQLIWPPRLQSHRAFAEPRLGHR